MSFTCRYIFTRIPTYNTEIKLLLFVLNKIFKILWLPYIFCCLIITKASGQSPSYNIINYKTKDGLPQNSVKCIQFDKAGYCWIGTEKGIVRFDGKNFKVYDKKNIEGSISERIAYSAQDAEGNIYFLNGKAQNFKIKLPSNGQAPYPKLLHSSEIWGLSKGLNSLNSTRLKNWTDSIYQIPNFLWENIDITVNSEDNYLTQKDKLLFFKKTTYVTIDTVDIVGEEIKRIVTNKIFIQFYLNGNLKAWKNGVHEKNITKIYGPLENNPSYKSGGYICLIQGDITYIYAGKTLYTILYHDGILDSKVILEDIDIPAISYVLYNKESKTYYIGSYVSGLYMISPSYFKYGEVAPESLQRSFYAQALTKNGEIYCQGYLYNDGGGFKRLPARESTGAALFITPDQKLYYGDDPRLFKFDLNSNKETHIATLDSRLSGVFKDKIDSSKLIFFTWTSMYRMRNDSILESKKVPTHDETQPIMSVVQSGRDSFLLGTQAGLSFYDAKNNKIYKTILNDHYIRSIYVDDNNIIWCSTYGDGYYAYKNGVLTCLPNGIFPALNTIHAFIDDGRGYFWLPTNDGLFKVKKEDLVNYIDDKTKEIYFYEFNSGDHLKTNEFNGGCDPGYLWLKDSVLSLPTLEGLVRFAPFKIHTVLPNKNIYISEIKIDGLDVKYPERAQLNVDPGFKKIVISVSSPFFGNKTNLRLLYKIEGLYDDWQAVPGNGEIALNRIPSGNYKIIVKKLTGFGNNDIDTMELEIIVAPWFYLTWWFILIVVTFLSVLIFQIIRYRVKRLKENNEKLQLFIDAQTRDLSDTVVRLAQSERELRVSNQMKDRVTTMVLHDLRSHIRFLHLMTNQLSLGFQKYGVDIMRQRLNTLKSTTAALNQFTEQFFGWAASQHANFKITPTHFDLNEILEEINELYNDIILVNNNKLIINKTNIELFSDRNILSIILRNIVDNANNSTTNGEISINAELIKQEVLISIIDNGKGFDEEALFDYNNRNSGTTKGGHGSTIVYSLLEKINGKLEIESRKDRGTTFRVRLNHYHTHRND